MIQERLPGDARVGARQALNEYGLSTCRDLAHERDFAMGAFL